MSFDRVPPPRFDYYAPPPGFYGMMPQMMMMGGMYPADGRDQRKRMRSMSPPYRQRDYYNGDYRDQKNSRIDDPASLPYLVTFRYFTDWVAQTQPHLLMSVPADMEVIEGMWRKYRAGHLRKGFKAFFLEMKDKPWFQEKYSPDQEFVDLRKRIQEKSRSGKVDTFLLDFNEGKFNGISYDLVATSPKEEKPEPPSDSNESPAKADEEEECEEDNIPGLPLVTLTTSPKQLFIKTVSPLVSRKNLEELCSKVPGFDYLALSIPTPTKKFHRIGWITFSSDTDVDEALKTLDGAVVDGFTLHMARNVEEMKVKVRSTPGLLAQPDRILKDLENIRKAAGHLEKELDDSRISNVIEERHKDALQTIDKENSEAVDAQNIKTLDLYIHYLRHVFHTCYYCVATCESFEQLERKCVKHVRRDKAEKPNPAKSVQEQGWISRLDEKLPLLVNVDTVDPVDFGGDDLVEEMHKICHVHVKEEEAGKYRCKECSKLFSALKFVEKHIAGKHPEFVGDTVEQVKYFNNYVSDPAHLPHGASEPPQQRQEQADRERHFADDRSHGKRRRPDEFRERDRDNRDRDLRELRNLPPPPGAAIDPRARRGASSYADLDGAPAGVADVELLPY